MLAIKQKPNPEPAVSDFKAAKTRWMEIDGKRKEMIEREEGMRLALALTSATDTRNVPQQVRDKAEPYLELAGRRRKKLAGQLEDLVEEIENFNLKNQDEWELWQEARSRETGRIALELQPRHRAAVKKVAAAIEALSLAITEETEVRAELARTAPEQSSSYLPNCVGGLNIGTLAEWGSPMSQWARGMRDLKILE